jgi:nucleoside-diphosphate-sugar epimerase
MKNLKVLVTGGSGFIGSEVIAQLLVKGAEIANIDFKPPSRPEHQSFWHDCDVRDLEKLRSILVKFDPHYVLHLASDILVTLTRIEDFTTTINGTHNVIAVAQELPNLQRFIHVSTQYVVKPGVVPKSETYYQPHTVYGEAKAKSETFLWPSTLKDWLILRPTTIWGPRHPLLGDAIMKYIANGRYLHPAAKEPILKCYGYVRNTAEQMIAFLTADLSMTPKRVFYVSDGPINQDLWIDGFACALTGKPARRVPMRFLWVLGSVGEVLRLIGVRFPMDMARYFRMTTPAAPDMEPTFAIVGQPKVPLAQGIEETVAWLEQARPDFFGAQRPAPGQ